MKRFQSLLFILLISAASVSRAPAANIADEFRRSIGADIVLILNGDDFGKSLSANAGVERAFEKGILTSASLVINAPHASQAVAFILAHPKMDVGVHLNIVSEGEPNSPILPISDVPTLVDDKGHFFEKWADHIKGMTTDQLAKELDAQVKRAIDGGVDVTHLDSHTAYYHADPRAFKIVEELAKRHRLPLRYPNPGAVLNLRRDGILCPDSLTGLGRSMGADFAERKKNLISWIRNLRPGLHEVIVHPATFGPDEKETWREDDMNLMLDPDVRAAVADRNIRLVGYRELRDFQRARAGKQEKENGAK